LSELILSKSRYNLKHHGHNLSLLRVGFVTSDPYLIRLALTILISSLSLIGTLRICLSTGVLLESRFAMQCLLIFKISYCATT